jgi:hypothetical protein
MQLILPNQFWKQEIFEIKSDIQEKLEVRKWNSN